MNEKIINLIDSIIKRQLFLKSLKKHHKNCYKEIKWISIFNHSRFRRFKIYVEQGMTVKYALEKSRQKVDILNKKP